MVQVASLRKCLQSIVLLAKAQALTFAVSDHPATFVLITQADLSSKYDGFIPQPKNSAFIRVLPILGVPFIRSATVVADGAKLSIKKMAEIG